MRILIDSPDLAAPINPTRIFPPNDYNADPPVAPTESSSTATVVGMGIRKVLFNDIALPSKSLAGDAELASGRYIYIQCYNGAGLTNDQLGDLKKKNIIIHEYLSDGAYLCNCGNHGEDITFKSIRDLKYLSRADIIDPACKTTPGLRRMMQHAADLPMDPYRVYFPPGRLDEYSTPGTFDIAVRLHKGAVASDICNNIRNTVYHGNGDRIRHADWFSISIDAADQAAVEEIAKVDAVYTIGRREYPRLFVVANSGLVGGWGH